MKLELNAALQTQAALSAELLQANGVLQLRDVLALSRLSGVIPGGGQFALSVVVK